MYQINDLLDLMIEAEASDLHLQVGQSPCLRIHGSIEPVEGPILTAEVTETIMRAITPERHLKNAQEKGNADFSFEYVNNVRFRVNVHKTKQRYGLVLRQIPSRIFSFEQTGLPEQIRELLYKPRGLFLVTGPTGSGKSTTLAALINYINENRKGNIITIEDPIEFYHNHKKCLVVQREVGSDTMSFSDALRGALREDPDVILVGEMRDLETIQAAISAAETGHLVFGTLHTTGAGETVDRIIDVFPNEAKEQVRIQLANSIQAVVAQVLCKKTGGGRVPAFEIMVRTTGIAQMIREGKTFRIASELQTNSAKGMVLLDDYLEKLYKKGLIEADEVLVFGRDTKTLKEHLALAGYVASNEE